MGILPVIYGRNTRSEQGSVNAEQCAAEEDRRWIATREGARLADLFTRRPCSDPDSSLKTTKHSTAMTEHHPSFSAVGTHLDELVEIAALARRFREEEGLSEDQAMQRAEREFHAHAAAPSPTAARPPSANDRRTEEAMHLDL